MRMMRVQPCDGYGFGRFVRSACRHGHGIRVGSTKTPRSFRIVFIVHVQCTGFQFVVGLFVLSMAVVPGDSTVVSC